MSHILEMQEYQNHRKRTIKSRPLNLQRIYFLRHPAVKMRIFKLEEIIDIRLATMIL